VLALAPVHPPAQLPRALQPRTHGRYGTKQSISSQRSHLSTSLSILVPISQHLLRSTHPTSNPHFPCPFLQVREGLSRLDVDVLAYGNLEESEAAELTSTMLRGVFPSAAAPASPPATSQHGWTAPTLASAPASLESWTPTGAVKSQGEDYALSPLYDGEAPQERTVMLPKRAHVRGSCISFQKGDDWSGGALAVGRLQREAD
jgi:hypothetical protein